ncbi:MAG: hypothetical protein HC782_05900 [Gammaproteobacteria bacterium]|nr:hypothetical protein [Gammaproteobacteria bacterium]
MNIPATIPTLNASDLPKLWYFKRPKLAENTLARAVDLRRIALFGPRQTGKTTFLSEEIAPLANSKGYMSIYIECWADRTDVMSSIIYALQKTLDDERVPKSGIGKTVAMPIRKVAFAGASLELGDNATRSTPVSKYLQIDALLTAILRETKKPILLIFDEFQVLANAPDAENAAAAVRAALTQSSKRVCVIFSGSSQTQLMQTFSRAKAPCMVLQIQSLILYWEENLLCISPKNLTKHVRAAWISN